MKYFASVSYDGSKFYGFQRLEDYDTVQKELERALGIINKNFVAVKGAGRTDRGVHAYSQGVCFELNGSVPTEKLKDVINRVLNNYVYINNNREKTIRTIITYSLEELALILFFVTFTK